MKNLFQLKKHICKIHQDSQNPSGKNPEELEVAMLIILTFLIISIEKFAMEYLLFLMQTEKSFEIEHL